MNQPDRGLGIGLILGVLGWYILLALFGIAVFAEDNNLAATAPTTRANGEPLTDLAAIRFYHSQDGADFSLLAEVPATEAGAVVDYLHANQTDGEHCYHATAVRANGLESEPTADVCKTVDTLLPSPPSNLVVR